MLVPIEDTPIGVIDGNDRVIELDGDRSKTNDTLGVLKFIMCLGQCSNNTCKY